MTATLGLPPELIRALTAFPDCVSDRASAALQRLTADRITHDGADAWAGSLLTGDGFPVELGFSTTDARLRYTVEPGGSKLDPCRRLSLASRALEFLGGRPLPQKRTDFLHAVRARRDLTYGAWIGGRHGPDGDEFKIYVETLGGPDGDLLPIELPALRLADRQATLRMVAYSPNSDRYEVYYRVRRLAPYHLPHALAPAGADGRVCEVLEFLAEHHAHSVADELPGPSVGISYSWPASGDGPRTVTVYFFARSLWGSDARIREGLGRVARSLDWDDGPYQHVTAPLADRQSWKTYHGLVGLSLAPGRPLSVGIGVRPWEAAP